MIQLEPFASASMTFQSENAGSIAENRITLGGGFVVKTFGAGGAADFWYDPTISRWRLVGLRNPSA